MESDISWLLWHTGCVSCSSSRECWDHHGLESHMLPISRLVFPMAEIGKPNYPEGGKEKLLGYKQLRQIQVETSTNKWAQRR